MRYFAKLIGKGQCPLGSVTPAFAEISDTEQEGLYFLFYYNKNGELLSDDCYFSLEEAKEQAKDYGCLQFGANGYWNKADDSCEQVESNVEIEWSCDCPTEILQSRDRS